MDPFFMLMKGIVWTYLISTINFSIQVNFLNRKNLYKTKGASYIAGIKSKPLPLSGQPVEQYNQYTPLTLIPIDCHKHFQLKLSGGEHIQEINVG